VSTPIIIDVEASGFGRGSYPIEVGFVLPDGTPFCFLIKPLKQWTHWDNSAEQVHEITRAQLEKHGCSVLEAAQKLNDQLAGQTVYSDGWGNDFSWISLLFECSGLTQQFKLESLRSILDEQQVELWHQTKAQVELELDVKRHRASGDARILQQTFLKTAAQTSHHHPQDSSPKP